MTIVPDCVKPQPSVAVNVTVYAPVCEYKCVTVKPVPVAPSPKFHAYVNGVPFVVAALVNVTVPLPLNVAADCVKAALIVGVIVVKLSAAPFVDVMP